MNNSVNTKNSVINDIVASVRSVLGSADGGSKGGDAGFDDILNEVKKRLSGQMDAADSGNSLPAAGLCLIPLSPSINVLTPGKPAFSDDMLRRFAAQEGLNPAALGLLMPKGAGESASAKVDGSIQPTTTAVADAGPDTPMMWGMFGAMPLVALSTAPTGAAPGLLRADERSPLRLLPALQQSLSGVDSAFIAADRFGLTALPASSVAGVVDARAALMSGRAQQDQTAVVQSDVNAVRPPIAAEVLQRFMDLTANRAGSALAPLSGDATGGVAGEFAAPISSPVITFDPARQMIAGRAEAEGQEAAVLLPGESEMPMVSEMVAGAALKLKANVRNAASVLAADKLIGQRSVVAMESQHAVAVENGSTSNLVWHEEIDLSAYTVIPPAAKDHAAGGPSGTVAALADKHSAENAMQQEKEHNAQQYQKLSDQLMDSVGKRVSDQVARGVWQMSFALRPARMGRIDVQIGMSGGEVDASFNASQADTHQLLEGGLERLKGALESAGMNVGHLMADAGAHGGGGGADARRASVGRPAVASQAPRSVEALGAGGSLNRSAGKVSADGVDVLI